MRSAGSIPLKAQGTTRILDDEDDDGQRPKQAWDSQKRTLTTQP
jgi:hypothetical protein